MLAQTFKTAEDLKLNDEQYHALLKTLQLFEMGEVEWVDTRFENMSHLTLVPTSTRYKFNMSQWCTDFHSCGTVACIGGTAEMIAGGGEFLWSTGGSDTGLYHLFFPHEVADRGWDQITVEIAAKALRNFLTTGWPMWEKLLPSNVICKAALPTYKWSV